MISTYISLWFMHICSSKRRKTWLWNVKDYNADIAFMLFSFARLTKSKNEICSIQMLEKWRGNFPKRSIKKLFQTLINKCLYNSPNYHVSESDLYLYVHTKEIGKEWLSKNSRKNKEKLHNKWKMLELNNQTVQRVAGNFIKFQNLKSSTRFQLSSWILWFFFFKSWISRISQNINMESTMEREK